ncbi:DUF4255 domain-containing protein [Arthrobacter antioxidans]|uniref:DUF4255 domain-containing protein n=1 Tax=Arthrobacter antioxidans TaxID=2895818 RepID=UPI001FFFEA69|nr:DUF4255 domain-containing protein [Arthrobacter antioxidans]
MSDFRGLAGVSATLRTLLRDRMDPPAGVAAGSLAVTVGTPRGDANAAGAAVNELARINLFLYQVSENGFLKNQDALSHTGAYGNPPLGLNLHYLVTAYGAAGENGNSVDESTAQQMLGSAMRVLHDFPLITEALVTVREPEGHTILHSSLRGDLERLKIALDPLSMEDLTKIWTALTIPFRASAAYSISAVELESQRRRQFPQLVGEPVHAGPRITILPLSAPSIASLGVRRPDDPAASSRNAPYVRIGDTLIIEGQNFAGGAVMVRIGSTEIRVAPDSARRIELLVPDRTYEFDGDTIALAADARLQPGVQTVEVTITPPELPNASARSNRAVLMLTPHVTGIAAAPPSSLTISGTRLFDPDLRGETLVGPVLFSAASYGTASGTGIELHLPDSLPHRSADAYVTDPLPVFAAPADLPQFDVTLGGLAATAQLRAVPASFAELAAALQSALRAIPKPGFHGLRAALAGDRLVLLAGGLLGPITIAGADAALLGLHAGSMRTGYLSGAVDIAGGLRTHPGAVSASRGPTTAVITLAVEPPPSAAGTARVLQEALHVAGPDFAALSVAAVDGQLLIFDTGTDAQLDFTAVPGGDQTTVAQLGLRAHYPVRVRVNGAEAIGGVNRMELPL